jgi:hypothetical protein
MPQSPIAVQVATPAAANVSQNVGTITTTGTFQAALVANPNRLSGGAIVNLGSNKMNVVFGLHTTAGTADAVPVLAASTIAPAGTLSFASFFGTGNRYTGEVAIEGTTADTFLTVENHS